MLLYKAIGVSLVRLLTPTVVLVLIGIVLFKIKKGVKRALKVLPTLKRAK